MLPWFAGSKGGGDMQDELSIEKARVAILVEERNELLRKVFELEEQVRRLTQRALDLPSAVVNHCVPVNGVHAPFCTGHESASQ